MVQDYANLNVTYRPDLDILFCRFVQAVTSDQLKNGYERALQAAQKQHVFYWLFDLRRRGPARQEDEAWILNQFFPQVEAFSTHQNFFAYLVTPTHYAHLRDTLGIETLENYSPITHIKIFDSEEKAVNWLANNQMINA